MTFLEFQWKKRHYRTGRWYVEAIKADEETSAIISVEGIVKRFFVKLQETNKDHGDDEEEDSNDNKTEASDDVFN